MDREDGEMSDDTSSMIVDSEDPTTEKTAKKLTVFFKAEKNGVIVQTLEKVDAMKLEDRAKRFGLNLTGNRIVSQKQIDELYANCGIESGNERHFRFDTIHLHGVDGLGTKDIFEYLEDYKPVSLEWIDATSCNVVCQDHIAAALALLVHSREILDKDLKNMMVNKSTNHWREGIPHHKQDFILMRFATNSDKKDSSQKKEIKESSAPILDKQSVDSSSVNPWGDLCQSWGVYDHQEVLISRKLPRDKLEEEDLEEGPRQIVQIKNKSLARRLGKRTYEVESEDSDSSSSDSEWTRRQKAPRMRMHADDEESRRKRPKSPIYKQVAEESFAPLSIEVVNTDNSYTPKAFTKLSDKFRIHSNSATNIQKEGVHSRLGMKVAASGDGSSDEYSDVTGHNVMSRVLLVSKKKSSSSVWSRLEKQTESSVEHNDLRQILKSRKPVTSSKNTNDLRSRLGKTSNKVNKGVSLRVEIDNDYRNESD